MVGNIQEFHFSGDKEECHGVWTGWWRTVVVGVVIGRLPPMRWGWGGLVGLRVVVGLSKLLSQRLLLHLQAGQAEDNLWQTPVPHRPQDALQYKKNNDTVALGWEGNATMWLSIKRQIRSHIVRITVFRICFGVVGWSLSGILDFF